MGMKTGRRLRGSRGRGDTVILEAETVVDIGHHHQASPQPVRGYLSLLRLLVAKNIGYLLLELPAPLRPILAPLHATTI